MSLIKSVSGIRGTIGGKPGDNLTPPDIIAFVAAYGTWLLKEFVQPAVVIGRDGRISGEGVKNLAIGTLRAMGIDVIDLDYSTTPSVEMYVISSGASGGIIITASHNPANWNALKFLNHAGEFISQEAGEEIKSMAEAGSLNAVYADVNRYGTMSHADDAIQRHIDSILKHPLIDAAIIRNAELHVVVDCINSTGNISIPPLLEKLGVRYTLLNDGQYGQFAHNPEPLEHHLQDLINEVIAQKANMGISIDPDVDRLALVCENGEFFGEEYTLVCAADYVLNHSQGALVTNLSSSRALGDLAKARGVECFYAPVGEVHVVREMKLRNAVLGGEGNGGIIDPKLHYGRDALIGIGLILMHMASSKKSLSELRKTYPEYVMVKDKITFDPKQSATALMDKVAEHFKEHSLDHRDGLKVDLESSWVQLRKSNTEPILRIYSEARTIEEAQDLVDQVKRLLS
ncbi:MAG: phosphoglucosamine mutase [Saprospiraceae bacterium]|uniref:Phosphoglucosamine mutase n=1 Tax=Candidatus Opimibacter skivensis TaxID=2982028 RepID=A0A9D7SUR1_9BACT|nr:phosphoglucosamine mutase [Candidatus Opimibacter skivensis]